MDIRELIMSVGMSARPGYYAGRGATTSDLKSNTLNKIADLIKEHYGDKAHDSFVDMVWKMKSLSATAFLDRLYALERSGWDLSTLDETEDHIAFENHSEAFGLIAQVLSHGDRTDQTDYIRKDFRKGNSERPAPRTMTGRTY